jgi:hypothetical protein
MGKLGCFALRASRNIWRSQEIVGSSHVFPRFGCLFLRDCHWLVLLLLFYGKIFQCAEFEARTGTAAAAVTGIEIRAASCAKPFATIVT